VGKGRATVTNSLRLLLLEAEIQGYIAKGLLSVGHAKVLLGVEDTARRAILARRVIEEGLSVRVLEKLVQGHKTTRSGRISGRVLPPAEAATVADIENRLTTHLGARVLLHHSKKRGRIIIEYAGNEDLQRILEKIGLKA
jgi:ParB family chromosome partitioning protein